MHVLRTSFSCAHPVLGAAKQLSLHLGSDWWDITQHSQCILRLFLAFIPKFFPIDRRSGFNIIPNCWDIPKNVVGNFCVRSFPRAYSVFPPGRTPPLPRLFWPDLSDFIRNHSALLLCLSLQALRLSSPHYYHRIVRLRNWRCSTYVRMSVYQLHRVLLELFISRTSSRPGFIFSANVGKLGCTIFLGSGAFSCLMEQPQPHHMVVPHWTRCFHIWRLSISPVSRIDTGRRFWVDLLFWHCGVRWSEFQGRHA